jgi:hypothetical protein
MRRNSLQLSRRHRSLLYLSILVLFLTGVAWAWLHYFHRIEGEFGPEFHPAAPWLLKAHGAAAMVSLIVLGTLLVVHVQRGWQAKLNRGSGTGLLCVFGVLIVSGYALYYVGEERFRALASNIHLWVGLALPVVLIAHIILGRRLRRTLHRRSERESSLHVRQPVAEPEVAALESDRKKPSALVSS